MLLENMKKLIWGKAKLKYLQVIHVAYRDDLYKT